MEGAKLTDPAWCVRLEDEGRIWIGQQNAAVRLEAGRAVRFAVPEVVSAGPVIDILEAPDGAAWLALPRLVLRLEGRSASLHRLAPTLTAEQLAEGNALHVELAIDQASALNGIFRVDSEGGVWFASAAEVFNDVTYGELPGHPEQYRMIAALDDELVARPAVSSNRSDTAAPPQDWAALG